MLELRLGAAYDLTASPRPRTYCSTRRGEKTAVLEALSADPERHSLVALDGKSR